MKVSHVADWRFIDSKITIGNAVPIQKSSLLSNSPNNACVYELSCWLGVASESVRL